MVGLGFSPPPVEMGCYLPTPQDCGKAQSASPVSWSNPGESQQEQSETTRKTNVTQVKTSEHTPIHTCLSLLLL